MAMNGLSLSSRVDRDRRLQLEPVQVVDRATPGVLREERLGGGPPTFFTPHFALSLSELA